MAGNVMNAEQQLLAEPAEHSTWRTTAESRVKLYDGQQAVSHISLVTDEDAKKEDKFCVGMVLTITMSSTDGSKLSTISYTSGRGFPRPGQGGKQQKTLKHSQATFRRLIMLADLTNPNGGVFCLLEKTLEDQKRMQKNLPMGKPIHVGGIYGFFEPSVEPKFLSNMMSILETPHPLYPLRPNALPAIPYQPAQENTSRYFVLHNATIEISGAAIVKTNCTGKQCDRRDVLSTGICGCTHFERNAGKCHVLQADVTITHETFEEPLKILNWSSLHFTENYVFNRPLPSDINMESGPVLFSYRKSLKEMVEHVNANSAFLCVLWHRLGLTTDASNSAAIDKSVLAATPVMHLEVLRPATLTKENLKTANHLFDVQLLS